MSLSLSLSVCVCLCVRALCVQAVEVNVGHPFLSKGVEYSLNLGDSIFSCWKASSGTCRFVNMLWDEECTSIVVDLLCVEQLLAQKNLHLLVI